MPTFKSIKSLFLLSLPIIAGQIGQMLIGTGDVYIAGLYSTQTVGAIGVANGLINPIFLFGIGLMMGISPVLAIDHSKNKDHKSSLLSILIYAAAMGLGLSLLCFILSFFIDFFPLDSRLVPSIKAYIRVVVWSFPFAYLYQAVKEFLQAREEVFLPNLFSIIAVVVNVGVNALLVFGYGSYEGIGEIGLAYASFIIRILLFLSVFFLIRDEIEMDFNFQFIKRVFKFSLPVAFMFFLEVLAFCTVSVLSGFFGVIAAAANNIIMTLASITFMVPLSISSAVAVRVGNAFGELNKTKLLQNASSAIFISFIFTLFSACMFYFFPNLLMRAFTHDPEVITLGVSLMGIVALFQLFDGSQVTLTGILRGMEQTKLSSLIVFVGYWLLGIPIGLLLAYQYKLEVFGLWIGLALSLALVAIFLSVCFRFVYLKFALIGHKSSDV